MIQGFKDFIMRGNVVDLAVALVLGLAFAAVVSSFVADILTPLTGLLGVPDFSEVATTLPSGATINWGLFINALIAFIIVALAVYLFVIVPMNRLKAKEDPSTKACTECTSEIPLAAKRCPMCTAPQIAAT
ncbi:MAG: large conductance mechanosensitive channel protein MscL [Candidatus Limnocylindria bacterium]